ncbi:MAG: transposase zinc-binding domain-containing protein [Elusimicrobia bacterium]|nr:transposase zinc-binding domain-containing protein [Elusimicrobiota bacterium]
MKGVALDRLGREDEGLERGRWIASSALWLWAVPAAEDSLRAFLECGIHRFGVVRFRCADCGESVFVPFSCKRRSCPTCDSKRASAESAIAMDGLLPRVPYRQWVLVLPKCRLPDYADLIFSTTLKCISV